jgi:Ca2+-binding EF-hand superfamily protein
LYLGRGQQQQQQIKMSETEAKDAFIIFDEAYEGNDVDAFYVGDILRALGCNVTNAAVIAAGGAAALGEKRIAFADFLPVLAAAKADLSSTGCKEDYVEGLKVFDKDGSGKVPLPEVLNVLSSLGEKLDASEAEKLVNLLEMKADEDDMISYMELIDKLLAATA